MCNSCFSEVKSKTTTTFTVEHKGCIIVIKNVPCLECQICGETTFSDAISLQLENLVAVAKSMPQDVAIIDYAKVRA